MQGASSTEHASSEWAVEAASSAGEADSPSGNVIVAVA
jgi:hypothetical protein